MSERLISFIRVENLFGMYSYTLPKNSQFGNANILYGDNGVGKSTILKLVFHLLSSGNNNGHRLALFRADFSKLTVGLASGVTVSATRAAEGAPGNVLVLAISKDGQDIAIWRFRPGSRESNWSEDMFERLPDGSIVKFKRILQGHKAKAKDAPPEGELAFLSALQKHAPVIFSLNADRRLESDAVPDPSDEMELRRLIRGDDSKRINDVVMRSREVALSQALNSAARWISRQAIQAANQGTTNVHTVYLNILRHLTGQNAPSATAPVDVASLQRRFVTIETKTGELARYELQTPLSTAEFRKALSGRAKRKVDLAASVLEPYVGSLEARISALDPTYRLVDRFVKIINGLLKDKALTYQLSTGFGIKSTRGSLLEPAQLSSGEQQLLLLFSYVLSGRDRPSVFMIDEPEISLNIKWQRQLVQSLLDITEGATIQFIFASHSLELLTQHRNRVIGLVNEQ